MEIVNKPHVRKGGFVDCLTVTGDKQLHKAGSYKWVDNRSVKCGTWRKSNSAPGVTMQDQPAESLYLDTNNPFNAAID